eukprot:gene55077-47039_t
MPPPADAPHSSDTEADALPIADTTMDASGGAEA